MPSLTREIPNDSDTARSLRFEIQRRVRYWQRIASQKFSRWRESEERVLAYLPTRETDRARIEARENGLPQYTTIQIPYSFAVVMAAHTYLTSVFFGRDPVFQYTGRHGESQQQVQALEALISYQLLVGRMLPYLYTWLYDSLKYGEGIVGCWWDEKIDVVTNISETAEMDPLTGLPGPSKKVMTSDRFRTYAGNRVYNIQPQDFIWDVRYTMREFEKGEFCGERKKLGWNEIIRGQKQGYLMNIKDIQYGTGRDWAMAEMGSPVLERPETFSQLGSSEADMGPALNANLKHPMLVGVYRLVMEIIPNEWKMGASDYPEKWVFTCTDDFATLIGAQPLGLNHCKYPYSVIPFEPEGYGLTTRGLPEILEPIQNTVDWLINSHFYNVRAALNNKFVVDPSRVVMKDVLNPLPGGIIRLKPEAYGSDTKLVMSQMPVTDVTRTHLQDFPMMIGIGERVGGVNDQIMGMLSTTGRKTATEVRTSTSFGVNRLKTQAEFASATGFDPLSMMMVQNTQQFYDMQLKFKIAGDLLNTAGASFIQVDPEMIAGNYDFVPVDGTLPIDRMGQVQIWEQMFQTISTIPQIGMQYDLGGIFQWVAQLAGLKNISQFKIQVAPDAQLHAAAQAGNAIPMGPHGPARPNGAGHPAPRATAGPPGGLPAGIPTGLPQ